MIVEHNIEGLLMAELTRYGHPSQIDRKGLNSHALLGQASKGLP